MTEDDARSRVEQLVGSAATDDLARLAAMVVAENERQNLVARSTVTTMWVRHILDSVQLLSFVEDGEEPWLDIGTGGGFPGLAIAVACRRPMTLVEPRRRRAEFLTAAASALSLGHVQVRQTSVERVMSPAAIISARAVGVLDVLFGNARQCATPSTKWLLPRGTDPLKDVETARRTWHGMFHVEQSLSNPDAGIVIASGVSRR